MKKMSVDELTRRAFMWAEQDRWSLAECWPIGSPERAEAESDYQQVRNYRLKKWGKSKMEAILEETPSKSINEIHELEKNQNSK